MALDHVSRDDPVATRGSAARRIGPESSVVHDAPVAIYSVTLDGTVLSWNPAAEELFGWRATEVVGRPLPFIHPENRQAAADSFAGLLEGRPVRGVEHSPRRKDGTTADVMTNATLLDDADGAPGIVVCFSMDVTAQRRAAEETARAEHRWRVLLESTNDTVTLLDAEGRVKQSTGQFTDVLGYPLGWWDGRSGFELIHPDDRQLAMDLFAWVLDHPGEPISEVLRTRHQEGHWELIQYTAVNRLDDLSIEGVVVTTHNVTELRLTEALVSDEAAVLELIARDAELPATLREIVRMVEFHTGGRAGIFLHESDAPASARITASDDILAMLDAAGTEGAGSACAEAIDRGRTVVVPDVRTHPLTMGAPDAFLAHHVQSAWSRPVHRTESGEVIGTIAVYYEHQRLPTDREHDVVGVASHLVAIATERDRSHRRLEHQARHDQLTGLPNRWAIVEHLDRALAGVDDHEAKVAVLLIDLDRFKMVNDSLGHEAGDRLLVAFGERLRSLVQPGDFVGHFGGDEFVVVLADVIDDEDVVYRTASRLDLALSEPFTITLEPDAGEHEIFLTTSIGVSMGGCRRTGHQLLQQADTAMFRAKDRGRDRLEIFDHGMQDLATEHLRVDRELRQAVERAELRLHYQPKVDLTHGGIVGAEALLRWEHPERGLVTPTDFIALAEETGLIVRIGNWVIDEAVRQARTWVDRTPSLEAFAISVNLSARQLTAPGLVPTVSRALGRYGWPPEALTLELTESILVDDADGALAVLAQLAALGVGLAIDDFGTGYSSLGYLHRFPFDMVKVDREFVKPLRADGEGSAVATAVMHMARALGLVTVAEGVEEPEQLAGLRALGCDRAQGFLFAPALPAGEFGALLASGRRW